MLVFYSPYVLVLSGWAGYPLLPHSSEREAATRSHGNMRLKIIYPSVPCNDTVCVCVCVCVCAPECTLMDSAWFNRPASWWRRHDHIIPFNTHHIQVHCSCVHLCKSLVGSCLLKRVYFLNSNKLLMLYMCLCVCVIGTWVVPAMYMGYGMCLRSLRHSCGMWVSTEIKWTTTTLLLTVKWNKI